jgi:hypothetical protein
MKDTDKTIALHGGKTIEVIFALIEGQTEARREQIKVRQIPIRDYEAGFGRVNDEIDLVGFLCGRDKVWALTLTPESYESILTTGREVNRLGFFTYCQRRMEHAQKQDAALLDKLSHLPPEAMRAVMSFGKLSTLENTPPGFHPPRA